MAAPVDVDDVNDFWRYFDCADETYEPQGPQHDLILTLDDLDPEAVKFARRAAASLGLPWPPHLPAAEEYALTHRHDLDRLERDCEHGRPSGGADCGECAKDDDTGWNER